jgi:hypothetical protein
MTFFIYFIFIRTGLREINFFGIFGKLLLNEI